MSDATFFREGLADNKLLVRVCGQCRRAAYPPMPGCPTCGHADGTIVESSGAATLYSWTVCHVAFDPTFADEVPYIVGLVDVSEGARVIARIGVNPERLEADMELRADYVHRSDGSTLLTFRAVKDDQP